MNTNMPSFSTCTSSPEVDAFGLPVHSEQAQRITSSCEGPLGEGSNMRSVPISSQGVSSTLLPPRLVSHEFGASICLDPLIGDYPFDVSSKKANVPLSTNFTTWNLPEGSMKAVPEFYPLEKTSTFVEGVCPSKIADRISDCLRQRSIAASFGAVKAKAKCKTEDGVEFRVKLYLGRGGYDNGIIVEVQRRSGWSSLFQQDVFAILEASEGMHSNDVNLSIPMVDDFLLEGRDDDQSGDVNVDSNVIPQQFLFDDAYDVKVTGMKMLSIITDVTKRGPK